MPVNVISATIQEFRGERYYLCDKYFQRNGRRLHVAVWAAANGGEPPKGFHVHHADHDRANNTPGNLELLPAGEHMSHHQLGHVRGVPAEALAAAAVWHGSDRGREWHRQHYLETADKLHRTSEFTCEHCAKPFVAVDRQTNRFCSNACKTRHRFLSGVDDVERQCPVCGAGFTINRYVAKRTCSRSCSAALRRGSRSGA